MSGENAVYRRVMRRETHAPRTAPAVVVATIALVVAGALVVGAVWWWVDAGVRETVAASFDAVSTWLWQPAVLIGAGVAALAVAVVLLALALLPGGRARRARTTDRVALVVDDGMLADAVADAVAAESGLDRRQVSVTLGRRSAIVRITPTSGVPVRAAAAARAADDAIAALGFTASARVVVSPTGVVA